ncbi:hypothetical protein AXA44_08795 [Rhodococcus sp. SC4]|nr:hypothetical protein AXA44_08795 [Rhodococcus sp. SC4]
MNTADHITVYLARRVVTMEPGNPTATAVAVRGDRIVEAGTLESLGPWLQAFPHTIDDRFADQVLLPGFIDPHLHPILGAILLTCEIATPEEWELPHGLVPACPDGKALFGRLRTLTDRGDPDEPLLIWGYHPIWHGTVTRTDLDELSTTRPIVLWHRSFHEIVLNTAAQQWLGLDQPSVAPYADQIDWDAGHFYENGKFPVMQALMPHLAAPDRLHRGLQLTAELVHRGGVTTCGDLSAGGMLGPDAEWAALSEVLDDDGVPFRTYLVPSPLHWARWHGHEDIDKTLARIAELPAINTRRLQWLHAVKTFADGAFFSQLMHLCEPGYIDGHCGEWITPPDELLELSRPFWNAGYDFYIHTNGDRGVDACLDVLADLDTQHPRPDFRYDLQHFGISREDQVTRLARLGASVSANGYYLHLLADKYAEHGIGAERAEQMTRLGSLARNGVPFSLHSDLPMGPVRPLLAVSAAVTRRTAAGNVRGPHQTVTVEQALRAVTIDAAWALRKDHEIGSIAAGKKADFTVLAEDPYEVDPVAIKDIAIRATVFGGNVHTITVPRPDPR